MVDGVGPHWRVCRWAQSHSHLQPGSINGAELVANSALLSLGIDGRIREVRSGGCVYLAHDHPASALITGIDTVADSLRGGCHPGRSMPEQVDPGPSRYKPAIESPTISWAGSDGGAAIVGS